MKTRTILSVIAIITTLMFVCETSIYAARTASSSVTVIIPEVAVLVMTGASSYSETLTEAAIQSIYDTGTAAIVDLGITLSIKMTTNKGWTLSTTTSVSGTGPLTLTDFYIKHNQAGAVGTSGFVANAFNAVPTGGTLALGQSASRITAATEFAMDYGVLISPTDVPGSNTYTVVYTLALPA